MSRSCYVLELSVVPGRARRADLFVYNRLVHIRRCLEHEFLELPPGARACTAGLAVAGETLALWVIEEGRLVRGVDLRPHIRLRVGAAAPLSIAEATARDDAWKESLATNDDVVFEIDWDAIASRTPALQGEPLHAGQTVEIYAGEDVLAPFDSYLEVIDDVAYGYEDLEGDGKPLPGFVDPDPPRASRPSSTL